MRHERSLFPACASLFAALFLVFSSCGWHADGLARLEALYPAADAADPGPKDVPVPDVSLGDVAGEGLPGHWAVRMVQNGQFSPLGNPWDITLSDLFLGVVDDKASKLTLTYCDQAVAISEPDVIETKLPKILLDAMARASPVIPLPGDGSFPAVEVAWTWGLKLADPKKDPLPTQADDPAVWDQDADGKPGVTVQVVKPLAGDRYMVRRTLWNLGAGTISKDGQRIEGSLTFTLDEGCLGATNDMLCTLAPVTPSQEGSVWQMRRVAADYGCERLVAEHAGIFGQ